MLSKLTVCVCKNPAAHNVGVLSAEYSMSLKCSLIKVFALWSHVCVGVEHVLEVNYCLQTTLTRKLFNYNRLQASYVVWLCVGSVLEKCV